MVRYSFGRFGSAFVVVLAVVPGIAAAAAVRFVAVAVNGERFAEPRDFVDALPGDRIEVELLISGWGTELESLNVWQVGVTNLAVLTPDPPHHCGNIEPINFNDPDQILRERGAYIGHELTNRGVCDETSTNAGESCFIAISPCEDTCWGGSDHGQSCDGGCPGGDCVPVPCSTGICLGGPSMGALCGTAETECPGGTCQSRDDFIFDGIPAICAVATTDDFRFGCAAFLGFSLMDPSACVGGTNADAPCGSDSDCPGGVCDLVAFYAGTVILDVGALARGTYTFGAKLSGDTFLSQETLVAHATVSDAPLAIRVLSDTCDTQITGACCVGLGDCIQSHDYECAAAGNVFRGADTTCDGWCTCPRIVASDPPNCAIDARYPHIPGTDPGYAYNRIGFDQVSITLSDDAVMDTITNEDITLAWHRAPADQRPYLGYTETIGDYTLRLPFSMPFPAGYWSCVRLSCNPDEEVCWGHLPGDVNNSGYANAVDLLDLIDYLNGLIPLEYYQCDTDDSGECTGADVLAVIDLLNGTEDFPPYNNKTQELACPSRP